MPDPKGGRLTIIPKWVTDAAGKLLGAGGSAPTSSVEPGRREPWFGPGTSPQPMAPQQDVAGRAYDYPNQINLSAKPRQYEGVSFETLRGLPDCLDIVRLCIETRKDQMAALSWSIVPQEVDGQETRPKADDRCRQVAKFLRRPDRRHTWPQWQRMIIDEQLTIDAVSIYVRRTVGGDVYSLEQIDGAAVKPLLGTDGRMPEAPDPAYIHVLKGMPATKYTENELLYMPLNPRVYTSYGMSPVQQIITTINIATRREIARLNYFTEGNIPEALISVPESWNPDQIERFQKMWNALMADASARAGAKFVPGGMQFQPTRDDATLSGPIDEWIARVVCYCFSLPPTAFVQMVNRATAGVTQDAALEEGLAPMMIWFKGLMDHIIQVCFGYEDLEFIWDDDEDVDPEALRVQELNEVRSGLISIDQVLARRGMDPIGMGPAVFGMGPQGIMFIDDLIEAKNAGLLKMQPPPPPQQFDEMGNPIPAMPAMPPDPSADAPAQAPGVQAMLPAPQRRLPPPNPSFDGIPPELLAEVGLGPSGPAGRGQDVTQADAIATDPLSASVSHPQVLQVLRDAEARHSSKG